jgi:hypothetical protein
MPLGLLLLGFGGFAGRDSHHPSLRRDGKMQLVLASCLFPLLLFAVPGVAVYDGERLFLVSSPMWAIAIGRGAALVWDWLKTRINAKLAGVACIGFLLAQGYGLWAMNPCYLSYYNLAIRGLPGAEQRGLETTYWGDSLTRDIWDHIAQTVPEGGIVHVTPVLHPLQLSFLESQLPQLKDKGITLAPCIPEQIAEVRYLVLFERKADLAPAILDAIAKEEPQFEITRQGVRLSAFYDLGQDPQ